MFCVGNEEELVECSLTLHSLEDGCQELDNANVVGAASTKPTDVPTDLSPSMTILVLASITVIRQLLPPLPAVMVVNETMPTNNAYQCGLHRLRYYDFEQTFIFQKLSLPT